MHDVDVQDLVPLTDCVKYFPRRPHYSTLWRWSTRGVRGRVLRTHTIGGTRFSTKRWVLEFIGDQSHAVRRPQLCESTAQRLRDERLV